MTSKKIDQIAEIRRAETAAKKALEKAQTDISKKEHDLNEKLSRATEEFENNLRDKNVKKLNKVTVEAEKIKETKVKDSQGEKAAAIKEAVSKQDEAVAHVVSAFKSHIR